LRNSDEITSTAVLNTGGVYKFRDFRPTSDYMREPLEDRAIIIMERECALSNRDISNDLECFEGHLKVKVKVVESWSSASHSRRSGTDHTVSPANYTMPAFTS